MASTVDSAVLTVRISEEVTLNGRKLGNSVIHNIRDVNEVSERVMTIPVTVKTVVNMGAAVAAGTFIRDDLKYLRITNLDNSNFITLTLTGAEVLIHVKIPALDSFILSSGVARANDQQVPFATATFTFTDKPSETTTITLTDGATTKVFEVDNDGGGVTGDNISVDPPTNNGVGMATGLVAAINAQNDLGITAAAPGLGVVNLTMDTAGSGGNTTITLSNKANWDSNCSTNVPATFTGGDVSFSNLTSISATADTAAVDIELFLAST